MSATADVMSAGWPIDASHALSSISIAAGGTLPVIARRKSSGDSSSN
jgi:hypothetical protein